MTAQPTLALDVAVRPPHWGCVCGRASGERRKYAISGNRLARL